MAKKVLVTGCSGYLGGVLVSALLDHPLVSKVVGIDLSAARVSHPRFKHYAADIRDEFLLRSIIEDEGVDVVYHLAFMMGEPRDEALARAINVGGTLTLLDACNKSSCVQKLILSASASAYGARRGNPEFLTEEDPLRADTLRYGIHKRLVEEELAKSMPGLRRSLRVVVLRICTIVGKGERTDGPVKIFCGMPVAVSVLFHKGALQFISEPDLMKVMLKAMEVSDFHGVYNVGPDDYTTIAHVARALGKARVPLPYFALWLALFLLRRLDRRSPATEKIVSYLAYPAVVSNAKLKKTLGVSFSKGSLEAFLECARALGAPAPSAEAEKSLL